MSKSSLEPFLQRDFLAFDRHRQDDPEYNALRLSIRRKLKAIADEVKKRGKELGYELASQGGIHHPHSYNAFRVREQRAYLCRSDKERKKLAAFFGEALGKDAETHYIQTVLEVSLDGQVIEAALRIHPQAWWDGENLRKKLGTPAGMTEWCQMLKALPPGYALRIHDWKKSYWANVATPREMQEMASAYTPGNHWLHLVRELPAEDAIGMELQAPEWAVTSLLALLPLYRFTLWAP
ncbi:MAG: hypothetical protein IT457_07535 [Planctomycetes bacterium]|nr:hypothetical protein [Planctomycetota bacterium]